MRTLRLTLVVLLMGTCGALPAAALDPPHDVATVVSKGACFNCHRPHLAAGTAITSVNGNANLCMTLCHNAAGAASRFAFADTDQAIPGTSGTSHRWNSGASGWVKPGAANTSTGTVQSAGVYTGPYAKTYTITITTAGEVGGAVFSWTATTPGGGSGTNVLTAASVALDQGITVVFTNGTSPSFKLNDTWSVYVRPDINQPTNAAMAARIADGKVMCSTCHDQHSQLAEPFDLSAPAYPTPGPSGTPGPGGMGRHDQRIADAINEMCVDCHSARAVTSAAQGSHAVGVGIPTTGAYKMP